MAGLTDDDGPSSPAVADGLVLRLGESAVSVMLHQLRRRCDEALMGLQALSGDSPEAPARKRKNRAEASPQ